MVSSARHDGAPPEGGLRMSASLDTIRVVISLSIRKRNGRSKILRPEAHCVWEGRMQDPHVLRAIARALKWRRRLEDGEIAGIQDIAVSKKMSDKYVGWIIWLAFWRRRCRRRWW